MNPRFRITFTPYFFGREKRFVKPWWNHYGKVYTPYTYIQLYNTIILILHIYNYNSHDADKGMISLRFHIITWTLRFQIVAVSITVLCMSFHFHVISCRYRANARPNRNDFVTVYTMRYEMKPGLSSCCSCADNWK